MTFDSFLPFQAKSAESKKAKKDKPADGDSDEEEVLDDLIEGDSEIESDEYDVPYDGEEDDIECDGKLLTLFPIIQSKAKTNLSFSFNQMMMMTMMTVPVRTIKRNNNVVKTK